MEVVPYKHSSQAKKEQIAQMFDNISEKYDFLNHLLSLGIDILWRKKAIQLLKKQNPQIILDVATGTGDFAIEALALNPKKVIGVDISEGMLEQGRQKLQKKGIETRIELQKGDSEKLLFDDNTFDAVIVAFGVRNFGHLQQGLLEMKRVLKPGGTMLILEFSQPEKFPFKQIYQFYFKNILPFIGRVISTDASAYSYLPESVQVFPYGKEFVRILQEIGLQEVLCYELTFGISSIYVGKK
ncbi:MAG: bifunctional demethylmenaquinone methyltransferase/2-methoxy-6-polyprenyl-1,4-benzoquinol methylase UbiE [Cytophagales bacterium]|nr:bifunctional demethylmenaquinone methyltransferase/2-methoxy-6-polyprenyl-1,4-benzoquinol methylase UbiE [Cytophagales bacterium]MDW8383915.1 bifunctional demethylmenaquinone methyltransferase/2-methoxy-6-polyprenyl-1,4-benzoquinol methylase UbiE [Flammeovirgaceae bacterium]